MNRTVIASVLLTGALGAGVLTLLPDARTIDTSALRLAIADRPCPIKPELVKCYDHSLSSAYPECFAECKARPDNYTDEVCEQWCARHALRNIWEDCETVGETDWHGHTYPNCPDTCESPMLEKWEYLTSHCMHHRTVDRGIGYCLCTTTESEPLTGEMSLSELPANVVRRYVSCRYKDSLSEDPDQWRTSHRWAKLDETPPEHWTNVSCRVVLGRELNLSVQANIRGPLIKALQEQCGDWVTPTHWRCCPDCLHYPAGCPPCPELCKYGLHWEGHEDECNQSGEI